MRHLVCEFASVAAGVDGGTSTSMEISAERPSSIQQFMSTREQLRRAEEIDEKDRIVRTEWSAALTHGESNRDSVLRRRQCPAFDQHVHAFAHK